MNKELDTVNVDIDSQGNARTRAITSGEQAYTIAEKLFADQSSRNSLEAVVDKKYNGDLPFSRSQLEASGELWRNNFSTGFMSGIIGKVIPAPVGLIDQSKTLTNSYLCPEYPEFKAKTDLLREEITRSTRKWSEWRNFQYGLWTEVVLHGNAIVAHLNPFSPWPEMYRTDRAAIPIGTGQHASNVPIAALMKDYLVHEFVEFIRDRDIADYSGWDTEAAIKTVNDALPSSRSNKGTSQPRSYEDAIREGNPGASYSGSKVIQVYHVLAVEPDTKKVTHYIVNRNGKHEVLFQKDDRFDKMEDVITLFTLEPGNGTFYGSKGLGRITLNMSIACEANRNLLFDQLKMAGMTIFKTDSTKSPTMQIRVRHPFLVLSGDGTIEQQQTSVNVESFIAADDQLSRWAEQLIGAYISDLHGRDEGAHPTATEEQIRAQREAQFKIAFLSRAYGQHADMMRIIQSRLLDEDTTDDIAKDLQKRMKEKDLTKEEYRDFLESPTSETSQDTSKAQDQAVIQAYTVFNGDPAFDQHKLKEMAATSMVSAQFAKEVLLDEAGVQANEIEAFQKQAGEDEDMIDGQSVPVSPRDLHEFHLKKGLDSIKEGVIHLSQNPDPKAMDAVNLMLRHAEDGHLALWKQAGATNEQLKPYQDAVNMFEKALVSIAENAQKGQQNAPAGPGAPPPGPPQQNAPQAEPVNPEEHMLKITSSIGYKDAPPSIRRQIEAAAGFRPAANEEDPVFHATRTAKAEGDTATSVPVS